MCTSKSLVEEIFFKVELPKFNSKKELGCESYFCFDQVNEHIRVINPSKKEEEENACDKRRYEDCETCIHEEFVKEYDEEYDEEVSTIKSKDDVLYYLRSGSRNCCPQCNPSLYNIFDFSSVVKKLSKEEFEKEIDNNEDKLDIKYDDKYYPDYYEDDYEMVCNEYKIKDNDFSAYGEFYFSHYNDTGFTLSFDIYHNLTEHSFEALYFDPKNNIYYVKFSPKRLEFSKLDLLDKLRCLEKFYKVNNQALTFSDSEDNKEAHRFFIHKFRFFSDFFDYRNDLEIIDIKEVKFNSFIIDVRKDKNSPSVNPGYEDKVYSFKIKIPYKFNNWFNEMKFNSNDFFH